LAKSRFKRRSRISAKRRSRTDADTPTRGHYLRELKDYAATYRRSERLIKRSIKAGREATPPDMPRLDHVEYALDSQNGQRSPFLASPIITSAVNVLAFEHELREVQDGATVAH
jgi:hypothetical protein